MEPAAVVVALGLVTELALLVWGWRLAKTVPAAPADSPQPARLQALLRSVAPVGLALTLLAALPELLAMQALRMAPLAWPLLPLAAGLLVAAVLHLRAGPALARWEATAGASTLQQGAKAVTMAGEYLHQTVGPFQQAVTSLAQVAQQLDTTALADRLITAADSFEAGLASAAESLTAAATALQEAGQQVATAGSQAANAVTAIDAGVGQVARALAPASQAAAALTQGLDGVRAAQEELAATGRELAVVLQQLQAAQQPISESMTRTTAALGETARNFEHLLVQLHTNEDAVTENLEQVYRRLNSAAERLERAAAEWGGLVRSGLAASHQFSQQAIEALLAGLEQAPLRGDAEAAAQLALAAARLDQAAAALSRGTGSQP